MFAIIMLSPHEDIFQIEPLTWKPSSCSSCNPKKSGE